MECILSLIKKVRCWQLDFFCRISMAGSNLSLQEVLDDNQVSDAVPTLICEL